MGWIRCMRVRGKPELEQSEKMDHIFRLLDKNDQRQVDRESNDAWEEYEAREVVAGRRKQRWQG